MDLSFRERVLNQKKEYERHYELIGIRLRQNTQTKIKKLSLNSEKYLQKFFQHIVERNQLFLNSKIENKFFLIQDRVPFFFSLPNGQIYASSRFVFEFLKTQDLLAAFFCEQLYRSHNLVYQKFFFLPEISVDKEKILNFNKLFLKETVEVNKWAYLLLKRTEYDPLAALSWMQILSKNASDFIYQRWRFNSISREEFLFRKFLIAETNISFSELYLEKNSSKEFYQFKNEIKNIYEQEYGPFSMGFN